MTIVQNVNQRIGQRIGYRIGVESPAASGGGILGVVRDSTSMVYTPGSGAEWTTFLTAIGSTVVAPSHLWLLQEVSGSPADSIGAKTLTASNVGYQKAITGWSRKAIGGPGTATSSSLSQAAMVNTATTGYAVLMLARFDPSPTVVRQISAYGTPVLQAPALTNKIRLREGGSIVDSTLNHNGTVHPLLWVFDVVATTLKLYTDIEKLTATYSASAGSTLVLTGSIATDATLTDFLYAAAWDGAPGQISDAQAKNLITGLGYSPPWS